MANLTPFLDHLPPLTKEDLCCDPFDFPYPDDILQLQTDCVNVLEKRVDINTFSEDYQERIKNYYRFTARRQNSKSHNVAKRTGDTLDIV